MRTLTADRSLSGLIEAARREPVILRRQARDVAVVLSMTEYERLTGQALRSGETSPPRSATLPSARTSGEANAAQRALLESTRGLWRQGDGLAWQRALRDEWRD
jgi:hypothetical protein